MKNSHGSYSTSLYKLSKSLISNKSLIFQMAKREILAKYKGSLAGALWMILTPLFMLLVYTFVFSSVFKAKWGNADESKAEFAVILFAGLIVYSFFSEVINRAPQVILSNINYVKKIVFPLEIFPVVQVCIGLFNAFISFIILVVFNFLNGGGVHWTIIFIPILFLPLIFITLGISWFLTSLGVFVRDINQFVILFTSGLLFLSPVFFPLSIVPNSIKVWMSINPLTFLIEQFRSIVLFGKDLNWSGLIVYYIISLFVMYFGFVWFQKTRKGFADVL